MLLQLASYTPANDATIEEQEATWQRAQNLHLAEQRSLTSTEPFYLTKPKQPSCSALLHSEASGRSSTAGERGKQRVAAGTCLSLAASTSGLPQAAPPSRSSATLPLVHRMDLITLCARAGSPTGTPLLPRCTMRFARASLMGIPVESARPEPSSSYDASPCPSSQVCQSSQMKALMRAPMCSYHHRETSPTFRTAAMTTPRARSTLSPC